MQNMRQQSADQSQMPMIPGSEKGDVADARSEVDKRSTGTKKTEAVE